MSLAAVMRRADLMLKPDPSRTVIRPFLPGDPPAFAVPDRPRARRIAALLRNGSMGFLV